MMGGKKGIAAAVKVLEGGGMVALATDTVYGLAANALDEEAVSKVYAAKGRGFDKPLIVFVKTLDEAGHFAEITPLASKLAARYLPGPLSLVLRQKAGVLAPSVTGPHATVGIRVPGHQVALALIAACGFPLAVTSANRSGGKPPKTAADIDIPVDLVLEGGKTPSGIESTVVDASGGSPLFLRIGALGKADIEGFLSS